MEKNNTTEIFCESNMLIRDCMVCAVRPIVVWTAVTCVNMVHVNRCGCQYAVLLSQMSVLFTVRHSLSLDSDRTFLVTDTDTAVSPDKPTAPHTSVNCPSSFSSLGCSCSIDLVVRCQGQKVTQLPQFREVGDRVFAELNMAGGNVEQLLPGDFLGLRVRRIVLTGNPINDRLSDAVFSTLGAHLTSLMLGACALRMLPPRLLTELTQLRVLHLWSNHVDFVPDSFFVATSELRELSLWGNHLQTISNRTFFGLRRLQILDLDRNGISVLERGALSHFSDALQVLRLSSNHIASMSDSMFADLHRLRVLTLASNRLRFVDARTFLGLSQLQTLCLADNRIQFLADGAFQHLAQLRTLDLSGNRLERVWGGTFVGLSALTSVDLSRNRLSRLPDATFGQSPVLRRLVVEDNWLSTLG